jgi:hypothetical protein
MRGGTVHVGIDCVEHFVDGSFLEIAPQSENCLHKLFLGNLPVITGVAHAKDVSQDEPHILEALAEFVDCF